MRLVPNLCFSLISVQLHSLGMAPIPPFAVLAEIWQAPFCSKPGLSVSSYTGVESFSPDCFFIGDANRGLCFAHGSGIVITPNSLFVSCRPSTFETGQRLLVTRLLVPVSTGQWKANRASTPPT